MHPVSIKRIYESVGLSKALYGSKLLNGLTDTQIQTLERAHKQCIKHIQRMPRTTPAVIAEGCLDMMSLDCFIDQWKLETLGQFCRLDTSKRIKTMFNFRLYSSMREPGIALGFMPEMYHIMGKYGLTGVLLEYLSNTSFPSSTSWKRIGLYGLQKAIMLYIALNSFTVTYE